MPKRVPLPWLAKKWGKPHSPYSTKSRAIIVGVSTSETIRPSQSMSTRRAVAHRLGVSTKTVDRLVARGELPVLRVAGAVRFDEADIAAYIERCRVTVDRPRT